MPKHGVDALSPQQLRCLRLVAQGLTSPEIAHEMGISQNTVNGYLAAAVAKLGVPSRKRAAAILIEHERHPRDPDKMTGENVRVDDQRFSAPSASASFVRDIAEHTSFNAQPVDIPTIAQATRENGNGGTQGALSVIGWVLLIAVTIVVVLLAVAPLADNASRLANLVHPYRH